jgi:cell division protein FtsL
MPDSGRPEIVFIVAMMLLTLVVSGFAMYFFVKTYKKEMREREQNRKAKIENRKSKTEGRQAETGKRESKIEI